MFVDMQCDKYVEKYDLDQVDNIGTLYINLIWICSKQGLECENGWTKFIIKGNQKCMKNFGVHRVHKAAQICKSNAAELPLPQSEQANFDTYAAFKGMTSTKLWLFDVFLELDETF